MKGAIKPLDTYTVDEAAELAGVKPAQLKLWLDTGKFKAPMKSKIMALAGWHISYLFDSDSIERLKTFVVLETGAPPTTVTPDQGQSDFTVQQIALMWQLSIDTIQKMFRDEKGVVGLEQKGRGANEPARLSGYRGKSWNASRRTGRTGNAAYLSSAQS
jgi:hypothetical protein